MPIPPVSLVSSYDPQNTASFNNTTAFNDLTGGTDFVFNSTPTYDSTYGAISFDGSNFAVLSNYLTNTWPTGTDDFTMSFWWKTAPNNPNKFAYLFFYGDGPNYIVPFSNYGTDGTVAILDNASHAVRTTNAFSEDVWYHFAFVKPAGGTFLDFTVYVNGIDQGALTDIVGGSATFSMAVTNNNSIRIQENNLAFISGGSLAQVWVYDEELTGTDILQQYYSTKTRYITPVASYDFSDPVCYPGSGSTVFDLAGSLNLPIVNATYGGTGQSKYFNFDGNGDYIGKNSVTGLGNTFTANIWYEPTVVNATSRELWNVGVNGASGTNPGFYLNNPSTADLIYGFSFGVGTTSAADVLIANTWQMATVTADGTTTKLYVDGVLNGSVAQGIGNWATGAFVIGAGIDGSGNIVPSSATNFLGNVALLDVYNTALGSTDITNIYNNTVTRFGTAPVPVALIGSYDFSDITCWPGSGNTVFDLTAEANDLTLSNPSGGAVTFGGTGQSVYASFNGDTTYLYRSQFSSSGSTFGGGEFTLSVWHNYNNPQDRSTFIMGGNGAAGSGIQLQVNGNDSNKITAAFGTDITEGGQLPGNSNTSNTWHMSTVTGDGTLLKLYQDGALIGSTSESGTWDGRGFIIGRPLGSSYQPNPQGPGFSYTGQIGIAEVYSGALGSTDISDLYDLQQPRFYPAPPPPYQGSVGGRQFGQGFNG